MKNSADPDQLASSELIWIYTVCKVRVYPGSAELGLILFIETKKCYSGPSCSKLMTSLVNDSLKFTSSDAQIC